LEALRLENIVYVELKKKKLVVFRVDYSKCNVRIMVQHLIGVVGKIRQEVITCYRRSSNLQVVIQKFGVCERYIIRYLRSVGITYIVLYTNLCLVSLSKLSALCVSKLRLRVLYIGLTQWYHCWVFFRSCIFNVLLGIWSNKLFSFVDRVVSRKNLGLAKLKKISGVILFALFSIHLENIIFWLVGCSYTVHISNALLSSGCLIDIRNGTKLFKQDFRYRSYVIFLALSYNRSQMLSDYVVGLLTKQKNHYRELTKVTDLLTFYYRRKIFLLQGIQL
jgi:hypothetical protein